MNEFVLAVLREVRDEDGVRIEETGDEERTVYLGRRQVGHVHPGSLHVPFPRSIGEQVVESGDADVHPYNPDSGWVEISLEAEDDRKRALKVLRKSLELAREANKKKRTDFPKDQP